MEYTGSSDDLSSMDGLRFRSEMGLVAYAKGIGFRNAAVAVDSSLLEFSNHREALEDTFSGIPDSKAFSRLGRLMGDCWLAYFENTDCGADLHGF